MIPFSRRRGASQTFRCPCRCNLHSIPGAITTKPNAYINANWIFWIAGKPRAHSLSRNSAANHASKIAPPLDYAQSLQRCSGTVSANLHSRGQRSGVLNIGSSSMAEIQQHEKGVGLHPAVFRKSTLQPIGLCLRIPQNGRQVRKSG